MRRGNGHLEVAGRSRPGWLMSVSPASLRPWRTGLRSSRSLTSGSIWSSRPGRPDRGRCRPDEGALLRWLLDQLASMPGYDPAPCGQRVASLPAARPGRLAGLPATATPSMNIFARDRGPGQDGVMRLLVLGGTHHVGRAVVETALARGDEVTTLNRGVSGTDVAGARPVMRTGPTRRAAFGARRRHLGRRDRHLEPRASRGRGRRPRCYPGGSGTTVTCPAGRSTSGRYRQGPTRARRWWMAIRPARRSMTTRRRSAAASSQCSSTSLAVGPRQGRTDPRALRAGRTDAVVAAPDRARRRRSRSRPA